MQIQLVKRYPIISSILLVICYWFLTIIPSSISIRNFTILSIVIRLFLSILIVYFNRIVKSDFTVRSTKKSFLYGIRCGLFCVVFCIWIFLLNLQWLSDIDTSQTISPPIYVMFMFMIQLIMISVFEEFAFRGLLLNTIEKYNSTTVSIILSSLLFSLIQVIGFINAPAYEIYTQLFSGFCLGVFFCAVYLRCKNIWVCIFLHTIWNFSNLFINLYQSSPFTRLELPFSMIGFLSNNVEAVVFLLIGIFLLRNVNFQFSNLIKRISNKKLNNA